MQNDFVKLAITSGEPAGIGPQISIQAAQQFLKNHNDVQIHLLGDSVLFSPFQEPLTQYSNLILEHVSLNESNIVGVLNAQNAPYVLTLLDKAHSGCHQKVYDAVVTAPIQKSVINEFGIPFTGHTEYFAEKSNISKVVMMLCGEVPVPSTPKSSFMRVALASTHLALKDVSQSLDCELIVKTLEIIHHNLKRYFALNDPQIYVAGLNPHAGESGYLGTEEVDFIIPAINKARDLGISALGPYPADTLFRYDNLDKADIFLAMYHDQGLTPLKMATFGHGVNVTLGLPYIRTSVDHGTALDISASGNASSKSMYQALQVAYQMVKNGTSSS